MPAFNRTELADLNVFVTICRRRSFRQAAAELGVSTSALSHAMRNLEARLGVKLLNRTSRSVVPTAAGSALAEQLDKGFETIGTAIDQLDRYRTSPVGRLRINVPRDASRLLIGPILSGTSHFLSAALRFMSHRTHCPAKIIYIAFWWPESAGWIFLHFVLVINQSLIGAWATWTLRRISEDGCDSKRVLPLALNNCAIAGRSTCRQSAAQFSRRAFGGKICSASSVLWT